MDAENSFLINYLNRKASVLMLRLNDEGLITFANDFTHAIAGRNLLSLHVSEFFVDFNAALDMEALMSGHLNQSLLNINTADNIPETFYFTSSKTRQGVLLIGEYKYSEIKELRFSMLSMNNELNNLTRELMKKNTQLEQLDKLKNEFLGMAAHDLRNPISSIYSFSDFIIESESGLPNDDLRIIVGMIKHSSEFMLTLLNELLDVVKIESGKLELNLQMTDLEKLIRNNVQLNNVIASKKEIKIAVNIPKRLPQLLIDPNKIEQVLNNLISNAIKYSQQLTSITIKAFGTDKSVIVTVQDQGQGIPKKELDLLFIPFSKINVKGTAGEKSVGLGLSIVKRIITGHRGQIWVESEVGKGTSFHFSLPLSAK